MRSVLRAASGRFLAVAAASWFLAIAGPASAETFPSIEVRDRAFVDGSGATRIFRGVNLSGSAKRPLPVSGATFLDHRSVSFVGRPLALGEADEHLQRIAAWGFDLVRLVVPWEAIEHAGPGLYDLAYLESIVALVDRAAGHGLWVIIDPHQDVWSRFTGGDGAPGWTLEAVGFDLAGLVPSGAAVVEELADGPLPPMIWPTNYTKLGSATMFTLFFGGSDFAPATTIGGVSAQEYLQSHFVAAYQALAERLGDRPNVLGFEVLNEPHPGWIGIDDLDGYAPFPLRNGPTPTPFQAMASGGGVPTEVARWEVGFLGLKEAGTVVLNPGGARAWGTARGVWATNGVWEVTEDGAPVLLRPDHFDRVGGRVVSFAEDYFKPFVERFAGAIREADPDAILLVVPAFVHGFPEWATGALENVASGAHFYDQVTLVKKSFQPWFSLDLRSGKPVLGRKRVGRLFDELAAAVGARAEALGENAPTLVGETGIPFDLAGRKAFQSGDFTTQALALDRSLGALERQGLSYAVWNYTPDNSNASGDGWNGEDLSVFSRDQAGLHRGIDAGGRALRAVVRPTPTRVAGRFVRSRYDLESGSYWLEIEIDPEVGETVVRVPRLAFPEPPRITASAGSVRFDADDRTLSWSHSAGGRAKLVVGPAVPPSRLSGDVPWVALVAGSSALLAALAWRRRRSRVARSV